MKSMNKSILVVLTGIFLLGTVFGAGNIIMDPDSTSGSVGGTVDVQITAENLTTLYGFQLDLDYDGSLLSFNSITYSDILGSESGPVQRFCIDETDLSISAGHVGNITCVRTIPGMIDPANGTLATVKLNIDNAGIGTFTINNVLVSDDLGNSVFVSVVNPVGTFSTCGATVCTTNLDCDDGDSETTDVCNDPGTCSASCSNIPNLAVCEEGPIPALCDCGGPYDTGYCCSGVYLASVACLNEFDCDDGNECTIDSCLNGNACGAACVNTPIAECGEPTPVCGDGVCHADESYDICPQDCPLPDDGGGDNGDGGGDTGNGGDGDSGDPGGGPGGGGGGTTGSEGYKAITRNLSMSPLTVDIPVKSNIIVSHGFPRKTAMIVQLHILKGLDLIFFTEEETGSLESVRSHIILFEDDWIPDESGEYEVKVVLSNINKSINFDIQSHTIEVQPASAGENTGITIIEDKPPVDDNTFVDDIDETIRAGIDGNAGTTGLDEEIDLTVAGIAGLVILVILGVVLFIAIQRKGL